METGEVNAQLISSELARIIPVRWDWEVYELGNKSFMVPFLSKEELERMIAIHTITTRNKEGTITFQEFVDDVQSIKVLEQVWVMVSKVSRALCSFLPFWAVGSIIGATLKVDMLHLRATGQVRILVAVYEAEKIPKFVDVCVGYNVYRLYFKPDEVAQHDGSDPEDDDLLSDEDGNSKEKDINNLDFEMGEANPKKEVGEPSAGQSQLPPQHPRNLNQKQTSLFWEALDLACDKLFNEISIKVMLESDDGTSRKSYTPLTEEELGSYNTQVDSTAKVHPSSVFFPPSPDTQVDAIPDNFQQGKDDVVEIVGDPTSPAASCSDDGSSRLLEQGRSKSWLHHLLAVLRRQAALLARAQKTRRGQPPAPWLSPTPRLAWTTAPLPPWSPTWGLASTGLRTLQPALCWISLTLLAVAVPRLLLECLLLVLLVLHQWRHQRPL
jgi:hypothetical protein